MRTSVKIFALALVILIAVPALAGGDHKKCTASTQECLDKMAQKFANAGWLGVEYEPIEGKGYWKLEKVVAGSPAEKAGLEAGQVILAINGVSLGTDNKDEFKKVKTAWQPGTEMTLVVKTSAGKQEIHATLGKMPEERIAMYVGNHMMEHATVAVAKK
jgi:C-terminal processing protease CtpA/Prc